ncbi:MAG: maleylpyruvate isomerase N-terminal domain-containing protein [Propionibacteriales bacterium]|nr:maleylpyruvate isomerase N-terminal domain-containing protein [Propionibacteriales bacterium]
MTDLRGRLPVEDYLAAIRSHTQGLAAAAEGNLSERIEHCPDWSVADLVWHLTCVHWFWNEIARDRLLDEPDDLVRPQRPADTDLVGALVAGVEVLVATLRDADQQAPCWTWGLEENVGFITRHQVQEAAVHHWDAVNATGAGTWSMDPVVALDAVDEFLTHSVANVRWPMPDAAGLGATVTIPVNGARVTISDGDVPGTVSHTVTPNDGAGNRAADLLLWLFRRIPDDRVEAEPRAALERFQRLRSTD